MSVSALYKTYLALVWTLHSYFTRIYHILSVSVHFVCVVLPRLPGMCIIAKCHVKIFLLACCRKRKKSTSVEWWLDGGRRGKTWGTGVVGRQWMSSSFTALCCSVNSQTLYLLDVKLLFSIGNETACGEVAFICLETYMGVYLMQFL